MSGNYGAFFVILFVIVIPGLPWWRAWLRESLCGSLIRLVALSTGISVLIHLCLAIIGRISAMAWFLCLMVNLVLALVDAVRRLPDKRVFIQTTVRSIKEHWRETKSLLWEHRSLAGGVAFIVIFSAGLLVFSASRIVPPLLDQDFETEATVWGLMYSGVPYCVNDRGLALFYAHPLLFHWYVSANALLTGTIGHFREYYVISARSQRELTRQADSLDARSRRRLVKKELAGMIDRFEGNPDKRVVRGVSVVFSVMTLLLLYLYQADVRRYPLTGLFPICFLLTTPEYVVRASYGGYMAISHFIMTLSILCSQRERADRPAEFRAGLLAGLANHKLVFLYVGQQIAALSSVRQTGLRALVTPRQWKELVSFGLIGFILGTALFWMYGLMTGPEAFFLDHVRVHLVDRLTGEQVFAYSGYLTRWGLWREFFEHQGWLFLLITIYALVMTGVRLRWRSLNTFIPLVLAIILFTWTDWRQTKHLMLLIPLVFSGFALPGQVWGRFLLIALCSLGILRNGHILLKMVQDFSVISPTPLW